MRGIATTPFANAEIPVQAAMSKPEPHPVFWGVDLVASCDALFTAQPEAPAITKAGASGWALNG